MTYVNKESVTTIGIIFPILVVVSLGIRALGWRRNSRVLGVDDFLIVPAAVLTIAAGVAMVIGAQMDIVGGHSSLGITPPKQRQVGKFEYAFWIGHVLAIGLIKLALLFLFRRIFKGSAYQTPFDYANWTLIVLVTLWTVVFLFIQIFACGADPSRGWASLESLRSKCVDTFAMQTGCAVFSWVMDLAILIEPLFMIAPLKMSFRKKLQVSLVFFCSIFAVIAGLLRMIGWIQIVMQGTQNPTTKILSTVLPSIDQEGIVSIILFWTYVEIGVGFQVACLPPCARHLDKLSFARVLDKMGSWPSALTLLSSGRRGRGSRNHTSGSGSQGHAPSLGYAVQSFKGGKGSRGSRSEDEIELYGVSTPVGGRG
ncbi:hypothetical protein P170DRAFT_512753 [Aspergillus steynii IBT 23096]|uniref:Rhodopsin domain-containing protein n=1 Tax=Aspergillus steynii IBT 23096 TaxID=1392250 RepID=A0A2I2G055_9EURO|nr:uncharacterized protein P170DRAFT_512753 [Aspergillus steynii IBT 23096]PLB46206.1 hypothetical protein P170DRAFT_512753 [Aspergillus steynii IBT 23096]